MLKINAAKILENLKAGETSEAETSSNVLLPQVPLDSIMRVAMVHQGNIESLDSIIDPKGSAKASRQVSRTIVMGDIQKEFKIEDHLARNTKNLELTKQSTLGLDDAANKPRLSDESPESYIDALKRESIEKLHEDNTKINDLNKLENQEESEDQYSDEDDESATHIKMANNSI